jgi:hypothetical protein
MHDNPGGVNHPGEPGPVVGTDKGDQLRHQFGPVPRREDITVTGKNSPAIGVEVDAHAVFLAGQRHRDGQIGLAKRNQTILNIWYIFKKLRTLFHSLLLSWWQMVNGRTRK